jgi:hypothetical protein
MNTNTPPTQLASHVVPGDSGRREEKAPLVDDDIPAVEEAMHDAMDKDDDPLQYLNTGAYDDGGLMAQQYDSGFEHDELMPELPENERMIVPLPVAKKHRKRPKKGRNAGKAASMSQPPPQPMVQDRIPIQGARKYHIPGNPILSNEAVEAIDGDLRRLHDDVLWREQSLIASENPGYPLYVVNVPQQRLYVQTFPRKSSSFDLTTSSTCFT